MGNDKRIYLDFRTSAVTTVRTPDELDELGTEYFQLGARVGIELPLDKKSASPFLKKSSFLGELGLSYIRGDDVNEGSHNDEIHLLAGWKLKLFDPVYVGITGGLGGSKNKFNFGRGVPLIEEYSLNGRLESEIGVEYCPHQALCTSAFGELFYEEPLIGSPDFVNWGLQFGIRISVSLSPPPPRFIEKIEKKTEYVYIKKSPPEPPPEPPADPGPEEPQDPNGGDVVTVEVPPPPEAAHLFAPFRFANESAVIVLDKEYKKGELVRRGNQALDSIAEYLLAHPEKKYFLHGHGNKQGDEKINNVLSLERVLAVRDYLIDQGVKPEQLKYEGEFEYKKSSTKMRKINAHGKSVHGDRDPVVEPPEDRNNRCVTFEENKP